MSFLFSFSLSLPSFCFKNSSNKPIISGTFLAYSVNLSSSSLDTPKPGLKPINNYLASATATGIIFDGGPGSSGFNSSLAAPARPASPTVGGFGTPFSEGGDFSFGGFLPLPCFLFG